MQKAKLFSIVSILCIYLGSPYLAIGQDVQQLAMRARINLYQTWNFDSVAYYFDQIIGKQNTPAFAYSDYGWYLMLLNKFDEGLNYIQQAAQMSPKDKQLVTWYAWALLWGDDLEGAKLWLDKAHTIDPDYGEALHLASRVASVSNNHKDAIELAERAAASDESWRAGIPLALALAGDKERAMASAHKISQEANVNDVLLLMEVYANLGKNDLALSYLQKSYELRYPLMPWFQFVPGTEHLHNDPRFKAIEQKMNLPK